MKDRIPTPGKAGRMLITPEDGRAPFFATVTMADEPIQDGDALCKGTLLKDATASLFGMDANALPDDVFAFIGEGKTTGLRQLELFYEVAIDETHETQNTSSVNYYLETSIIPAEEAPFAGLVEAGFDLIVAEFVGTLDFTVTSTGYSPAVRLFIAPEADRNAEDAVTLFSVRTAKSLGQRIYSVSSRVPCLKTGGATYSEESGSAPQSASYSNVAVSESGLQLYIMCGKAIIKGKLRIWGGHLT